MIICFSGTGNTEAVARRLDLTLREGVTMVRGRLLTGPEPQLSPAPNDRTIVWAFPTYSWGIPPLMAAFMERVSIPQADSADHFMVTTCGDDTGMLDRQWRRIMARRGWKAKAAFSVAMPNTYTLLSGFDVDPAAVEQAKIDAMAPRADAIAALIAAGSDTDSIHRGALPRLKSAIYPWFSRHGVNPRRFVCRVDSCVSCGKCAGACPTANITMTPDAGGRLRPVWGDSCAMCLACYHTCPVHAVEYGRATRSKGRYDRFLKGRKRF